jgi:hypothetical protein
MSDSPAAKRQRVADDDVVCSCEACHLVQVSEESRNLVSAPKAACRVECQYAVREALEILNSREAVVPFSLWREALNLIVCDQRCEALPALMGATTSESTRDLVQYAWMYVWHAIVEEGRFMRLACLAHAAS